VYGLDGAFTQMGLFFTKAALLTFGGAYAVLPYVVQGAVEHHHWATGPQMIDGLALGETTPGPLIMVVAFVGFLGGWKAQVFGPDALFAAGATAAAVVTFFTFLPSFIFVLAGGPVIEATHGDLRLTAPLTAITAAVVGVIVNLALFFAGHVFWPQGLSGPFDTVSALIAAGAAIALFRFQWGVLPLLGACGARARAGDGAAAALITAPTAAREGDTMAPPCARRALDAPSTRHRRPLPPCRPLRRPCLRHPLTRAWDASRSRTRSRSG